MDRQIGLTERRRRRPRMDSPIHRRRPQRVGLEHVRRRRVRDHRAVARWGAPGLCVGSAARLWRGRGVSRDGHGGEVGRVLRAGRFVLFAEGAFQSGQDRGLGGLGWRAGFAAGLAVVAGAAEKEGCRGDDHEGEDGEDYDGYEVESGEGFAVGRVAGADDNGVAGSGRCFGCSEDSYGGYPWSRS